MTMQSEVAPTAVRPVPTMRAALLDRFGDAESLRIGVVPVPEPVLDEVLVHVVAAGVGTLDVRTRAGLGAARGVDTWPAVLGHAFSGVVLRSTSSRLHAGDEVFGMSACPRAGGSFAEFTAVPSTRLARKPRVLSHAEAAGVPLPGLTAWSAVVDAARAHEGQRLLVHAGQGSAGRIAVQLAAYFGADVSATGPADQAVWLRDAGARRVVDTATARFEDVVDPVDAVIDLAGIGGRTLGVLRRGGLLVQPAAEQIVQAPEADTAGVRLVDAEVVPDATTLAVLERLITSGELRVPSADVLPLERIADAHRLVESGAATEVVLQVSDY